jgi:hypothetical protein
LNKGFDLKVLINDTWSSENVYLGVTVMNMNTKKVLAGLVLATSGFFAAGASAAEIAAWDWVTDGGFNIGGSTCSNGGEAACALGYDNASGVTPSGIAGTASVMTWGTPSSSAAANGEQSGLQGVFGASGSGGYNAQLLGSDPVAIPMFEQIITNGGWTNTGAAIHYNNIITPAGGHMSTSMLETTFQLLTPGAGPVNEANIGIVFSETNNNSPCPGGNPHGTICDDIFSISSALPPITFVFDGITYKASFRFFDGPGSIVDGNTIYTAENSPGTAVMYVQGRIDTIPLPGILFLMGMGLMMLGWRVGGRRKLA